MLIIHYFDKILPKSINPVVRVTLLICTQYFKGWDLKKKFYNPKIVFFQITNLKKTQVFLTCQYMKPKLCMNLQRGNAFCNGNSSSPQTTWRNLKSRNKKISLKVKFLSSFLSFNNLLSNNCHNSVGINNLQRPRRWGGGAGGPPPPLPIILDDAASLIWVTNFTIQTCWNSNRFNCGIYRLWFYYFFNLRQTFESIRSVYCVATNIEYLSWETFCHSTGMVTLVMSFWSF